MRGLTWTRARAWKVGWFFFVLTVSCLVWVISGDVLPALTTFALLSACSQLVVEMSSSIRLLNPSREPRRLRFSIGQFMVVAGMVAGYLAILRALFTALPAEETGILAMLSVASFILYAIFCGLGYRIWLAVRNIRAVLRGDRIWERDRPRVQQKVEITSGGDACRDDPN